MSLSLTWLVDQQLRNLTGAQFKLAAYLYRRLQRKPELTIRAKDLAKATGLSEKSARSTASDANGKRSCSYYNSRLPSSHYSDNRSSFHCFLSVFIFS
jgi:hypothetical protein